MQHTIKWNCFPNNCYTEQGKKSISEVFVNNSDIHYYHTFSKCILYAYKTFVIYYMHKVSPHTDTERTLVKQ